jgi:phage gp16-like protein
MTVRRTKRTDPARRNILAAIHVLAGPKHLGLDEDVYRDLVERISGEHGVAVRSAGDCDGRQLHMLAKELRRLAGEPEGNAQAGRERPARPKGDLSAQLAKVEALLADAGRDWNYAHAIALRVCKVHKLEWCNKAQLQKVIAAMQYDANRRAKRAQAEE